jgi:cytochrome c oxidase subunit II
MTDKGNLFLPPGRSTFAPDTDALFNFIYYTSIVFFAIVCFVVVYSIIRYRRRVKAELTSGVAHNTKLEIIWTLIPTVLVFIVFAWGFRGYLRMFVIPKGALEIKVTAQRWFWSFDYPNGATSVNDLVVPVGKPIKLLLSSKDVIHSFFVPDFRIKMDALPNRYTMIWFEATDTGSFNLFCTEYCGKSHSSMVGKVRVKGEREYADWLESSNKGGEGIAPADYGAQLYSQKACITCHSVDGKPGTGPSFKGVYGEEVRLEGGKSVVVDENYIRESILNPQAKVVLGYQPVMPTFQGVLKDKQIDALIAFIKSLKEKENEKK